MASRPFFVMPGGVCVPLEGDWRVAYLRGEWYVLGHNSIVRCGSKSAAESMVEELESQTDIDRLANQAIEELDRPIAPREADRLDGF